MSKSEAPAGTPGGQPTVPTMDDLPARMRVHALARLLGRPSREVLTTLADLGVEVRGPQSSVDRKVAEQVLTALSGMAVIAPAAPGLAAPEPAAPAGREPAGAAPTPASQSPTSQPAVAQPTSAGSPGSESAVADPPDLQLTGSFLAGSSAAPVRPRAAVALAPVFAPPAPLFQPATPPVRTRGPAADPGLGTDTSGTSVGGPVDRATGGDADQDADEPTSRRRTRRRGAEQPDESDGPEVDEDIVADLTGDSGDPEDDEDGAARRRRRRGRRGRGRGRGGDGLDEDGLDDGPTGDAEPVAADMTVVTGPGTGGTGTGGPVTGETEEPDDTEDEESDPDQADGHAGSRRRRRRRRRGSGDDASDAVEDDPPGTVTRVRAPREPRAEREEPEGDGVQSVRGSTRLEAKRQRRRDGRDAGRRKVPILSEAEFLARRESVDRSMVVRERGDRVEIGVLEDEILVEHFIADVHGSGSGTAPSLVGNIYLGRVQNVLPSMEAAFIDIGRGRNAVLYAGEVDWDAAGLGGKARRIEQALSGGDPVLVQVTKDPIGHKGARLTTQISLAGRFLVYVPSGGAAGISRKLPDVERKRLKDILREIVPSEAGVIIRTASEGVSHEALERDVRRLQAQWEVVEARSKQTGPNKPKAPVLLYEEPDLLIKVVRDQFNEDFTRLVVQGDTAFDTLSNYVGHVAPELADRMHRHVGTTDAFTEYRIDEQLLKALDRKVWLPSGGTLVIDRTEAMTVVDVNTGKFTGSGGNLEETVTRNNLEAAEEIVRQLRLRDIGGIIVIDFIDMVLEANRDLVLRRLTECLSRDRTRHQVAEVTSLGLVQMTRKRVGGGLLEHFSTPCEHCRGRGVIVTAEPVVDKGDGGHHEGGRPDSRGGEGSGRRSRRGRRDDERTGNDAHDRSAAEGSAHNGASRNGRVGTPIEVRADGAAVVEDTRTSAVPESDTSARDTSARDTSAPGTAATDVPEPVGAALMPVPAELEPIEPAEAARNGRPAGRRRGRVTRTAGAPTATVGGAADTEPAPPTAEAVPVGSPAAAGSTAAGSPTSGSPTSGSTTIGSTTVGSPAESAPAPVPTDPEPAPADPAAARPRRARRAASRPAGPPAAEPGAAEPIAAEPIAAEPIAAEPIAAEPGAADPGAHGGADPV